MKRLIAFVCTAALIFLLPACGQKEQVPEEPITLFPVQDEQTAPDALVSSGQDAAKLVNKSYGQMKTDDRLGTVRDASATFRTADSYALESVAYAAAKTMFAATVSQPDTLYISDAQVFDCADDGACVYYRVYLHAAYRVETGEEIRRTSFLNVGVRKDDKTAFDASEQMREVLRKYSVFTDTLSDLTVPTTDWSDAAAEIACARLKYPDKGRVVETMRRDDLCDEPSLVVYDAVCAGVNDFDKEILCSYTVYMTREDGQIRQVDPAQIEL